MNWVATFIYGFAALYPAETGSSEELEEALAFIGSEFEPELIVRAGYGAGIVALLSGVPLVLFAPIPLFVALALAAGISLVAIHLVHTAPKLSAALARTRALGETPNLIGRAVLRMQIQPAIENAVRFSAETGSGPLSESLQSHIDAAMGTPRTGLLTFADEWSDRFPALRRSSALLVTAQDAPEGERGRTLDRALQAVLDGTRNQMAEFTSKIRGPATALYAFGVLIPLALVALFPAAGFAGFTEGISVWFFVVVYNVLLPLALVGASYWLLVRRPVAFPPPKVSRDHPDVPTSVYPSLLWGIGIAIGAYALTFLFGPQMLAPVSAAGLGFGAFLIVYYRPIMLVRNHIKEVEEHMVDALYLTGRLVSEDNAVEAAIDEAGEQIPGETGEVFEQASNLQRRLHVGVYEAFNGIHGALRDVPSTRADSTANLLAIASEEGQPAGRALVSMADHLEDLQEVEQETRRSLSQVTDTLENTAAYFAPMVAGATVGLAGGIAGEDGGDLAIEGAATISADLLGLIIGVYVIILCFILVPLSLSLKHGFDRSLVGYRVGTALLSAIPIYLASVILVGQII
jgi:hypothetical protein